MERERRRTREREGEHKPVILARVAPSKVT